MDAVTEILVDRSRGADKITRMVMLSLVAHAVLLTTVAFLPNRWNTTTDNARVMTISLGGAPGPLQGHNVMAGKAVQEVAPPNVKPKNDAPPALPKPEMVEPVKTAKPAPKAPAKPEPRKDEQQLHSRTPTQGAEIKQGGARVETHGAAIPFGGLATGGGGIGNATTDYADFCCPEYLQIMTRMIYGNWQAKQGVDGSNQVKFTIKRDGTITDIQIEQGTNQYLNLASQRALAQTRQLPPLPAAFTPPQLTVHLVFQYQR